jgi:hypothetical protein
MGDYILIALFVGLAFMAGWWMRGRHDRQEMMSDGNQTCGSRENQAGSAAETGGSRGE